jgi:hypothetical protein
MRLSPSPVPLPSERELLIPNPGGGAKWATLGGAFGLRLAVYYAKASWLPGGAEKGRRIAFEALGFDSRRDEVWVDLVDEFADLTTMLRGRPFDMADPGEQRLTRLAVILTWYQQISVSHGAALKASIVNSITPDMDVDYLAGTVVHNDSVDTIAQLMSLASERLPRPQTCQRAVIEPQCHPGQADLILDGLLLEVKACRSPSVTADLGYQLLGYLLSLAPRFGVTTVGWYFARHGIRWEFPVEDFLEVAAGEPVALDVACSEWADV